MIFVGLGMPERGLECRSVYSGGHTEGEGRGRGSMSERMRAPLR